jgi:hypothetical protein
MASAYRVRELDVSMVSAIPAGVGRRIPLSLISHVILWYRENSQCIDQS